MKINILIIILMLLISPYCLLGGKKNNIEDQEKITGKVRFIFFPFHYLIRYYEKNRIEISKENRYYRIFGDSGYKLKDDDDVFYYYNGKIVPKLIEENGLKSYLHIEIKYSDNMYNYTIKDSVSPVEIFSHYGGQITTPYYLASTTGNSSIEVIIKRNNEIISQGKVMLTQKDDWARSVRFRLSPVRFPGFGIFGCKSFPVEEKFIVSPSADSLFITWGGNSISNSNPCTY